MKVFSEDQVRALADVDSVIRELRLAFSRDFAATLQMPPRITLPLSGGLALVMPAFDSALNAAGVKIVSVTGAGVNATYEFLDTVTGRTLAVMEANWLTELRTAATSAVATDLLARGDAGVLAIFGCGKQAIAHLIAIPRVRKIQRFLVCGRTPAATVEFCAKMKNDHGINAQPANAETCAREADVICTCTNAGTPLFDGHWLRDGTHLNLVGTFQPDKREVDDVTARRSRIVVDTYDGALAESGDLIMPLQNGVITRQQVVADLHEIASGKKQGRVSPQDITLFKSVGCALEDLVTAQLIYAKAEAGLS